jgi:ATP-binding cassette subfamily B protein
VGENGAGKSTLVKLLVRLYDPLQGRILVDGIDLREFDLEGWRRNLSVIFQDFARFCLTARENVGFGDLSLVDDLSRIRAAAELSGAGEMIEKLPGQWETVLGKMFEGGHELSVGQWQKVALARAFLKESSILVLDEPTASLDAKQEYEVFRQFEQLTAGKTALLISHRFSSVRMAQRIFVLKAGHLVEEGTHQELMVLNGQYAQMYSRQAAGYC